MNRLFSEKLLICEKHLDTFGHVNNAVYLELYEQARWNFITDQGYGMEVIDQTSQGPVLLELNLKFKAEIKNREQITITSQFREMKNSLLMVMDQKMIKPEGKVASELEIIVGLMDLKKRKLVKPSRKWLEAVGVQDDQLEKICQS